MKLFIILALIVILLPGCVTQKFASTPNSTSNAPQMIVTPDNSLSGKVVSYNSAGRYVVLSFPIGRMPQIGQTLFLYRAGLKVAEIKITGPQRDNYIVADVITGDAQSGEEARDQ